MRILLLVCAAVFAGAALSACGSTCGEGTVLAQGQCIPETLSLCGKGTAFVDGACVATCKPGTAAGTDGCVVAEGACGAGTVLSEGKCVVQDPMTRVTDREAEEPNDTLGTARRFTLPAKGAAAAVLGGIVNSADPAKADWDAFVFTAPALAHVRIEATAVGVPSVGVVVSRADAPGVDRWVASVESRDSTRDVVLPAAGDYFIKVTEATNIPPGGSPRGSPTFSYIVSVTTIDPVSERAWDPADDATGLWTAGDLLAIAGDPSGTTLYSLDVTTGGTADFSGLRGVWAVDSAGNTVMAGQDTVSSYGTVTEFNAQRLVVPPGGVKVLIDPVMTLPAGLTQTYKLKLTPQPVEALDGALPVDIRGTLEAGGSHIYSFDAPEGVLVSVQPIDFGYDIEPRITIFDSTFQMIADSSMYTSAARGLVAPGRGGRCYFILEDRYDDDYGDEYEYQLVLSAEPVVAAGTVDVPGTVSAAAPVDSATSAWFMFSAKKDALLDLEVTADSVVTLGGQRYSELLATVGPSITADASGGLLARRVFVRANKLTLLRVTADGPAQASLVVSAAVPDFQTEREPNETVATAQPVTLSETWSAEVMASLAGQEMDVFSFTLDATMSKLEISTSEGVGTDTPDTEIELLDASGTKVDEDDDDGAGLFSLITRANGADAGTYYVQVHYASSYTTSTKGYALRIIGTP